MNDKIAIAGGEVERAFFNKYHTALRNICESIYVEDAQKLLESIDAMTSGRIHKVLLTDKGKIIINFDEKLIRSIEFRLLFKACIKHQLGVFFYHPPANFCFLKDNSEFLMQDVYELNQILKSLVESNPELAKKLKNGELRTNELQVLSTFGLTDNKNRLLPEVVKYVEQQLTIQEETFVVAQVTPIIIK